jgi:hypothetical protein
MASNPATLPAGFVGQDGRLVGGKQPPPPKAEFRGFLASADDALHGVEQRVDLAPLTRLGS